MSRRMWIIPLLVVVFSSPLRAQLTVIDQANLTQAVLIAHRAQQHYEELQAQYRTIMRMARALENLDGFRIPPIAISHHDTSRWSHGQAWLRALNTGDPTGSGYWATAVPLLPPTTGLDRLPPAARRVLE